MSYVCTQELPDKDSDNYFLFLEVIPAQTRVIVPCGGCQEDTLREMEVRKFLRKEG